MSEGFFPMLQVGGYDKKQKISFIRYRSSVKIKDLTLVLGSKCKDGIVLVADSKVLRGADWEHQSKIDGDLLGGVVVGAAGTTAFFDKFKRHIVYQTEQLRAQKEDGQAPYDNIEHFLVGCERILRTYKEEYELEENQTPIELLIAINIGDGKPSLHHLNTTEQVTEEEIHKYLPIGHGEPYSAFFLKKLWNKELTMSQTAVLFCAIIEVIDKNRLDISVGGNPNVWFIPNTGQNREILGNDIQQILNQRDEFLKVLNQKMDELHPFLGK
jgi:20S proteasome alpha/beta subunit